MTPSPARHGNAIDVMLLLTNSRGESLLALRRGTGYADGMWNFPSGKLEADETVTDAVIRETREEIGITLTSDEPRLATVVHHRNPEGAARLGLIFHVRHDLARHGEAVNAEPHKCAKLAWYPLDMLPDNTFPYTAAAAAAFRDHRSLALDGWENFLQRR